MPQFTSMRPAAPAQLRPHGQYAAGSIPPYALINKSPISIKTKAIPSPSSKTAALRKPSISRTQSTPSTTTAPMFPDEIIDNLYISDLETARAVLSPNYAGPGRPKIKYVLTLLDNAKDQPQVFPSTVADEAVKSDFVLKLVKISDLNEVNLLEVLPEACAFIKQSLSNKDGGVLVHCRKGVSRSGSVIVAFLMQELGLSFEDALQQAKRGRSKIWPNRSFGDQLRMWKDLEYALLDANGGEKAQYEDWKSKTKFRPLLEL